MTEFEELKIVLALKGWLPVKFHACQIFGFANYSNGKLVFLDIEHNGTKTIVSKYTLSEYFNSSWVSCNFNDLIEDELKLLCEYLK